MIQLLCRISNSLDGSTILTDNERDPTPVLNLPGVSEYIAADVGRFSPALVFPAGQEVQGWRFDFAHVVQNVAGVVVAAEIEDGAGNPLDDSVDFMDLTFANASRVGADLIIPQGYFVRLQSDGTTPITVRLGFTPLITPVDYQPLVTVSNPA